jgi:hypothetical protein
MIATIDFLTAARAEALFLSDLPVGSDLTREQIEAATCRTVQVYGGTRRCAAEAVARYCDRPEIGVPRMRWARHAVEAAYAHRPAGLRSAALTLTPALAKAA